MKVQLRNISNLNTLEEIKRASSINFGMIQDAMAGGLAFQENIKSTAPIDFEVTSANQVVRLTHNLSFTPSNYLVVFQNGNACVFAASQSAYPWTGNFAYLTASAPVKARVILF